MDGEPPEVGHNPPSPQPLRHRARRPAATKEVGNQIAFVAACFNDALQERFRFLRGIPEPTHSIEKEMGLMSCHTLCNSTPGRSSFVLLEPWHSVSSHKDGKLV